MFGVFSSRVTRRSPCGSDRVGLCGLFACAQCIGRPRFRRRASSPQSDGFCGVPRGDRRFRESDTRAGRRAAARVGPQRERHAAAAVDQRTVPAAAPHPRHDARRADGAPARPPRESARAEGLVDRGDARDALAPHRENDAVLAQPFRLRRTEGALAAPHVSPEPAPAAPRAREFRHAAPRGCARSGDGDLPRQRLQPQSAAERELRARGDGALHSGRRTLHRAGRERSRPRVHRLEHRSARPASSCSAGSSTTTA